MQNPANFEYKKLLAIYLEDRRKKRKNTSDLQLRDLERKSGRELATAGRFYIKKRMYTYAIDWLQRAGNYPQAQQVLGLLYLRQPQLAADGYDQAKRLFMKSRTAASCFNLGTMYNDGLGIRQDREQAIRWFVEGGLKGLRRAKFQAGLLYFCDAQTNRESAKLAYYWLHQSLKKRGNKKNDVAAIKLRELVKVLDYDIESLVKSYNPYKSRRQVYHSENDREDDEADNDEDDNDEDDSDGEDVEMEIQSESSAMAASSNYNYNTFQPESSSFMFASDNNVIQPQSPFIPQPESSFMAASNDMMQSQASFIPFTNTIAQPESSSFMFASDNNVIQPQSPFIPQPESSFMAASNDMMQSQASFIPFTNTIAQPESSFMSLPNSSTNVVQQSESTRIRQLEQLNRSYKSTIKILEDKLHMYRSTRGDHIHKLERSNKVLTKRVGDMEKLFYAIAGNDINNS